MYRLRTRPSNQKWINQILAQIWTNVDAFATIFVQTLIEPQLHKILDRLKLHRLLGLRIKRVELGTTPARVEGIKVYDKKVLGANIEEIILDCDVVYVGEARVVFTVQGISAQIIDLKFRGRARVHLKPLVNTFPFVGGFEIYFLNMPILKYHLGGIGKYIEVPGIKSAFRSVVEDVMRSRFVWPGGFKLYFPLDDIQNQSKTTYMLPRPAGLLSVTLKEASDLLKKDKLSGKSDPYAVISIGETKVSFRKRYVPKTVNPTWDYSTAFIIEDPAGHELDIYVYDFDTVSADDFLGRTSVSLSHILQKDTFDDWIALSDVKHGDIHLHCDWKIALPASEDSERAKGSYIISIFIDRCQDLVGGKSGDTSVCLKCKLRLEGGKPSEEFCTLPSYKTEHPVFEEGFLLLSEEPSRDKMVVEVVDVKGKDTVLGTVTIPIDYLETSENEEFINKSWSLDGGPPNARIFLSSKLYIFK